MSETGFAQVPLDEYNRLRDFYKGIQDGRFINIFSYYGDIEILNEKELIKKLVEENKRVNENLNNCMNPKKEVVTISDLRRMSFLELWKWKRKNKTTLLNNFKI